MQVLNPFPSLVLRTKEICWTFQNGAILILRASAEFFVTIGVYIYPVPICISINFASPFRFGAAATGRRSEPEQLPRESRTTSEMPDSPAKPKTVIEEYKA